MERIPVFPVMDGGKMKEFILSVANVRQLQARPPETQILVMQSKIIEAIKLTDGNIAVSYSGGKESGFLLYHVAQIWKETYGRSRNLVAIFANTGCEFKTMWPFIQHFVEWLQERFDICIDLRTVSAKQPFSKTIKTIGYLFQVKNKRA